jgi:DNA-binding NtrC family response regulator
MPNKSEILIIDNDKQLVDSLSALLKVKGYIPFGVYTGAKGLDLALNDVFELILLNATLADFDSLELMKRIKGLKVSAPVIVLADNENFDKAIEIMRNGAANILLKPLRDDLTLEAAANAIHQLHLEKDVRSLRKSLSDHYTIMGRSEIIEQFREKLKRIALSASRALLFGEPGSGKRFAAKYIHFSSSRAAAPFHAINCAMASSGRADDAHRLECDLFGNEKGAFVGADSTVKGAFELADGGTLYLDEVGALPKELQAKLLRTIESGSVERMGSAQDIRVDTRVLAGTTVDLETEVKSGRFREDLYFRLNVIPVLVPPLRSYLSDILYLARFMLDDEAYVRKWIDPQAVDFMKSYSWPGNIRQLKEAIIRAARISSANIITVDNIKSAIDIGQAKAPAQPVSGDSYVSGPDIANLFKSELSYREHVTDFEKRLLEEVLGLSDGNITKAAKLLNTDRGNLSKKIKQLGLKKKNYTKKT